MHSNTSIILSNIFVGTLGRSVRKTFIDCESLSRPTWQADAPTERPYRLSLGIQPKSVIRAGVGTISNDRH